MSLIKSYIHQTMRVQFFVLFIISFFIITLAMFIYKDSFSSIPFYNFYQKNLRGYLFSGFISVGSFLLSLHTFVIVNLKDKLFSTNEYKEIFIRSNRIDKIENIDERELFKPLDRLSYFLNYSIWLAIITAISQFTIGLADNLIASITCIWLAVLTICFMLNSLIIIRENIKLMLRQTSEK
ncbi:hypothetical protein PSI23_20150 [Xenorhabdus sp. XENO-10]|uniref:Uncharacterized protein n=1 Tax=Xenorhabdus yunnanensis TaxID=3025878 RepID=A0ABT5LK89_9GAMM|nr:hypothetical protein [Xenorhabdus yunnanensis]MDC9591529.1 hypothetical protein [Xenorhabdus yunnanensis]